MPRPPRLVVSGLPHHVTQRGNYRQRVFFRADDRLFYRALLSEFLPHYGIGLEGYCMMENHVHLVVIPHDANGLSRALQRIHSDYARAVHLRLRRTGHLWQARFHSTPLDDKHFLAALLYVERNPVRAGLVTQCGQWRWSSAPGHLGLVEDPLLDLARWRARFDATRWKRFLEEGVRSAEIEDRIREATLRGRLFEEGKIGAIRKPAERQRLAAEARQASMSQ